MPKITLLPAARHDLDEIWDYIAEANLPAADRLIETIDQKLSLLAERPKLGAVRFRLIPGLRIFPVGNYNIFYRSADTGIEVIRVLQASRDTEGKF
ncbi:MAG: type II toxin-antitoxin system RelE/ParE family toxin [Candidatus Omnitrophota bacterium]